ncbi:class I SAM-dependent methyltransferase [Candidatus Nitrospira bockiana]
METVPCLLCGSDHSTPLLHGRDWLHQTTDQEFMVVQCKGCGLRYLNPRPSPSNLGRYYPSGYFPDPPSANRSALERSAKRLSGTLKQWIREDYYGYPPALPSTRFRSLRKLLLWPEKTRRSLTGRHPIPWVGRGRLLDVGCNVGQNMRALQDQGWDVYGIDLSPVAVERARRVFDDRVKLGVLETAGYEDGFFDVLLFSHSLEHMPDPLRVLKEARRILADHGRVVIVVPNAGGVERRIFGPWWVHWDPPRHLYHFDAAALTRLLAKAGFTVKATRTGVGTAFFMGSLERFLLHRFGIRFSGTAKKLVEKLIADPVCLIAGNLGLGTELVVSAGKSPP